MNQQQQQLGDGRRHDDDAVLAEFLSSLMDYTPTIPDELVEHFLGKSGFHSPDVRLIRLVAVATQKFVADVASDALQHNEYLEVRVNFKYRAENFARSLASKCSDSALVQSVKRRHCKARSAAVVKDKKDKQAKDKRLVLTMEDLSRALREYGVNVKHQEYFADSPSTGMDPASREE